MNWLILDVLINLVWYISGFVCNVDELYGSSRRPIQNSSLCKSTFNPHYYCHTATLDKLTCFHSVISLKIIINGWGWQQYLCAGFIEFYPKDLQFYTSDSSQVYKLTDLFLQQLMRISRTSDHDLITFINLNLAIIYLRTNRQADLAMLLEHVEPDRIGLK